MNKKAVDVVLLPPEKVMDRVIEMNKKLRKENPNNLKLGKHDYIPHISLGMSVIDEEDFPEVEEILKEIQKEFSSLELEFERVNTKKVETGEYFSAIVIKDTDRLQELHERVIDKFEPYMGIKPSKDMFYGSDEVLDTTLNWVRDFKQESSFENFLPHISVGLGVFELEEKPSFKASKIAVCHLGKFCTCRNILMASELR